MIPIKQYMAEQMVGKTFHFKCDCLMSLDIIGRVVDYEIAETETIFTVDVRGKLIPIGTNHPKLSVELV